MLPDEILLPEWAKMVLIVVLAVLAYKAWKWDTSNFIVLPEPEEEQASEAQEINELDQLNPDYGAYVWLAGKRYN